jgi:hypothetical protein
LVNFVQHSDFARSVLSGMEDSGSVF